MPKLLVLTAHAIARVREREIRLAWVDDTVRRPDWSEQDPQDAAIERRFRTIEDFGGRVLRVACVETETSIRVISAMFDRDARRPS